VRTNPPTIALVVNKPDLFTPNYERFLMNRFREELPYGEVPIRLVVRARRRDEVTVSTDEPEQAPSAEAVGWSERELAELPEEPEAYFDE
jgi:GTP-binding protein